MLIAAESKTGRAGHLKSGGEPAEAERLRATGDSQARGEAMTGRLIFGIALLSLTACGEQGGAEVQLRPGEWAITQEVTSVRNKDLPSDVVGGLVGRPVERKACIDPEQAARPDVGLLTVPEDGTCSGDFLLQGGKISGTRSCAVPDIQAQRTTTMEGEYGPDSYAIRIRSEMRSASGMNMVTEARSTGRRVGDCPKSG